MEPKKNLAVAYSMQRRQKKAKGGPISVKDEKRPMPSEMDNDKMMAEQNSAKDAADVLSSKMAGSKPDADNEFTPSEMRMLKKMAAGGPVNRFDDVHDVTSETDGGDNSEHMLEGVHSNGGSAADIHAASSEPKADSFTKEEMMMLKKMARGGQVLPGRRLPDEGNQMEESDDQPQSVADAVMRKRSKLMLAEGGDVYDGKQRRDNETGVNKPMSSVRGKDTNRMNKSVQGASEAHGEREIRERDARPVWKKFAEGGEVDLALNAKEDKNDEDDDSFNALKKENYSESDGLDDLHDPEDSNLIGDMIDKDDHDRVGEMRKRMKAKRGF